MLVATWPELLRWLRLLWPAALLRLSPRLAPWTPPLLAALVGHAWKSGATGAPRLGGFSVGPIASQAAIETEPCRGSGWEARDPAGEADAVEVACEADNLTLGHDSRVEAGHAVLGIVRLIIAVQHRKSHPAFGE